MLGYFETTKLIYISAILLIYIYYIFNRFALVSESKPNLGFIAVLFSVYGLGVGFGFVKIAILLLFFVTELFLYFYAESPYKSICFAPLYPAGVFALAGVFMGSYLMLSGTLFLTTFLYVVFIGLSLKRGYLRVWNGLLVGVTFFILIMMDFCLLYYEDLWFKLPLYQTYGHFVLSGLAVLVFFILEMSLRNYEKGYMTSSKELREQLLTEQYEEIQSVYLNMRGWRHDYHNHIQMLKATMDKGQYEAARSYLDTIERALHRVDTHVKSGNVMADAILNSKLTLAENKQIQIKCEAYLPSTLFISDVDLCTILGNVLDNAIESCEKVDVSERFIRIYLALNQSQFYMSVQNAALDQSISTQGQFESTKGENHGLGTKRMAAVVRKWEGFMSLNQQPGVFATEISIPLPE